MEKQGKLEWNSIFLEDIMIIPEDSDDEKEWKGVPSKDQQQNPITLKTLKI